MISSFTSKDRIIDLFLSISEADLIKKTCLEGPRGEIIGKQRQVRTLARKAN